MVTPSQTTGGKYVELQNAEKEVVLSGLFLPDQTAGLESLRDQKAEKEIFGPNRNSVREKIVVEDQIPGKEVYHTEPEVAVDNSALQPVHDQEADKEIVSWTRPGECDGSMHGRICGLRRVWFLMLLVVAVGITLAVALGVGFGYGLNHSYACISVRAYPIMPLTGNRSSTSATTTAFSNDKYLIGGAIDPAYYSTTGVFNGTGIAVAAQSFGSQGVEPDGEDFIYFQYYTGEIRWTVRDPGHGWINGGIHGIVAGNARNNTPLSVVSYVFNEISTWHVFYIDIDNYIREKVSGNGTYLWTDGTIDSANLLANDQEQVGMQACWYPDNFISSTGTYGEFGISLWYAKDNATLEEWRWIKGGSHWNFSQEWSDLNGHAGVGCYTWGPGLRVYAMFANNNNSVEFWWREISQKFTNSTNHSVFAWTKADFEILDVYPSTSMSYTNFFYIQHSNHSVMGYNISWDAENTALFGSPFIVSENALAGTDIMADAIPLADGGNDLVMFAQQDGNTIVEWTRNPLGGTWSNTTLPIS